MLFPDFFIFVYLQIAGDPMPPIIQGRFKARFRNCRPSASSRRSGGSFNGIWSECESMAPDAKLSDLFPQCQELCHRYV